MGSILARGCGQADGKPLKYLFSMALALGVGQWSCTSGDPGRQDGPWASIEAAEAGLRKIACSLAWSPQYLADPGRFRAMTPEQRLEKADILAFAVPGTVPFRAFVIGDPSESKEPPSRSLAILVLRDAAGGGVAKVISPEGYFPEIFGAWKASGYEPTRMDLWELCLLYVRLFGGVQRLFAIPELVLSAGDIPAQQIPPQDLVEKVKRPTTEFRRRNGDRPDEVEFRLLCSFCTWDFCFGTLKEWHFEIKYSLGSTPTSSVREKELGEGIGDFGAPK